MSFVMWKLQALTACSSPPPPPASGGRCGWRGLRRVTSEAGWGQAWDPSERRGPQRCRSPSRCAPEGGGHVRGSAEATEFRAEGEVRGGVVTGVTRSSRGAGPRASHAGPASAPRAGALSRARSREAVSGPGARSRASRGGKQGGALCPLPERAAGGARGSTGASAARGRGGGGARRLPATPARPRGRRPAQPPLFLF